MADFDRNKLKRQNRVVAMIVTGTVFGMVGLSFASVPLYKIFCQVTGYGGTTQRADAAPETVGDREIRVVFDANVNAELGWDFRPVERNLSVKVGEQKLAFYRATNEESDPSIGVATFNVTPMKAGKYFSKIDCFCFNEQRLEPGQSVDMPISFYVDPAIEEDPNLDEVKSITLSYTFFRSDEEPEVVETSQLKPSNVNQFN